MKRVIYLTMFILVLVIFTSNVFSQATVSKGGFSDSFTLTVYSLPIEPIEFNIERTFKWHTTIDNNGGFHLHSNYKFRGDGIGLISGDSYKDILNRNVIIIDKDFEALPNTYTYNLTHIIIGKGKTDNIKLKEKIHFTINANGEVTADFEKIEPW